MVGNEEDMIWVLGNQSAASSSKLVDKIDSPTDRPLRRLKTEGSIKIENQEGSGICRVCLEDGDIPIHGNERSSDVSRELNTFAGINVREGDVFPKHLCQSCNSLLQGAMQLRTTAQYSERILLQQIKGRSRAEDSRDHESWPETDSGVPGCHESVGKPSNINNMFDLKVINKGLDSNQRSSRCYLKIEPLILRDKVEKQGSPKNQPKHIIVKMSKKNPQTATNDNIKQNIDNRKKVTRSRIIIRTSKRMKPAVDEQIRSVTQPQIELRNDHQSLTTPNKPFTQRRKKGNLQKYCRRCKINFETVQDYRKHKKTDEHKNRKEVCPICHKLYSWGSLKLHQVVHNRVITHVCDICGKGFCMKSGLVAHLTTHSLFLPFKCAHCAYRGRNKHSLRIHMRTHTGEKPHQCSVCAERFTTTSNLKSHVFTNHKTGHDFMCDICSRGFHRTCELQKHIRADHMGIKDHVCDTCGKAFGFRKQMMKHKAKVHKRKKLLAGRTPLYLLADQQGNSEEIGEIPELLLAVSSLTNNNSTDAHV